MSKQGQETDPRGNQKPESRKRSKEGSGTETGSYRLGRADLQQELLASLEKFLSQQQIKRSKQWPAGVIRPIWAPRLSLKQVWSTRQGVVH